MKNHEAQIKNNMIIDSNSYFRKLPKILIPEQVVVFNAIQYSLDICDISYDRLRNNLSTFANPLENEKPSFPLIFSDVWSIFQHTAIFLKIVKTHFKIEISDPLFDGVREVIGFRDTSQHIDERITQALTKKNLPIYGTLSWYSQETSTAKAGVINLCYSGTLRDSSSIYSSVNPAGKTYDDLVNDIEYRGIVREKTKGNSDEYPERTISLNQLMVNLSRIARYLDDQASNQLSMENNTEYHASDVILQLLVEKSQSNK